MNYAIYVVLLVCHCHACLISTWFYVISCIYKVISYSFCWCAPLGSLHLEMRWNSFEYYVGLWQSETLQFQSGRLGGLRRDSSFLSGCKRHYRRQEAATDSLRRFKLLRSLAGVGDVLVFVVDRGVQPATFTASCSAVSMDRAKARTCSKESLPSERVCVECMSCSIPSSLSVAEVAGQG